MSEKKRKGSRKRHSSKLMRWLQTEGRRYCAIALCASLILGNIGQMAAAADSDPDKEFELDRVALYEAVQEAVLGDPVDESSFSFTGDASDTYAKAMFEDDIPLYELKPEIDDNKGNLKLRIFAKLGGDVILDDDVSIESGATQLYEIDGNEEFYFLLTNTSTQEQTAVIRVGEKETELITVVPNSAVVKSEPEGQVAAENLVDATALEEVGPGVTGETAAVQDSSNVVVSGSVSNSNSSGGGGGNGSGSGTTVSKTEDETVQETTEVTPEVTQPVETEVEKETQIAEESKATDETIGALEETNADETEDVKESEAISESDETKENEVISGSEASKENDTAQESGSAQESGADQGTVHEDENQAEADGNATDNSAAEENISDSASEGASDTLSEDTGAEISIDNGTSAVEDSGNETVVSVIGEAAGISLHKTYRVATSKATASNTTPSDAEEELASDSNATDSNAAKDVLDGQVWEAVSLDDAGVVVFATTAEELNLDPNIDTYIQTTENAVVIVKAEKGMLPEGVELSVAELDSSEENADKYQLAQAAVADEDYAGMVALDISFWYEGEEIEPEGYVDVAIKMNSDILPKEANPNTVAVQHLIESEDGNVQLDQVADSVNDHNGSVEVTEETIIAEYSVDSFSTFLITWGSYFSITVHYVNTNGGELNTNDTISSGETIEFASYKDNADTLLAYAGAYYGSETGEQVTSVSATVESNWSWSSWKYVNTYILTFYNGSTEVDQLTTYADQDPVEGDVYLVYQASDVVETPEVTTKKELSRTKTVISNDDGTYDLNLSVSGAIGSTSGEVPIDILLIVDKSNSMSSAMIKSVQNAIDTLTDVIGSNACIDERYSIVQFNSYSNTKTILDWTNDERAVDSAVDSSTSKGTNYEAAIDVGIEQLKTARSDAYTYVIFLTDGEPSQMGTSSSMQNSTSCQNAAEEAIKGMGCTSFYAIGIGDYNSSNLEGLCGNVNYDTTNGTSKSYGVDDIDKLSSVFAEIAAEATTMLCNNVVITDILSENVQVVMDTAGTAPEELVVTVTDANGNTVADIDGGQNSATVTLAETEQNPTGGPIVASYVDGQVKLVFPESYKLEENWTYTVTIKIRPSEEAYEAYRESGYTDTGDAGTGTYAEEKGFYSNKSATVTYKYNDVEESAEYAMPVIQINPGTLVIKKQFSGLDSLSAEELDAYKKNLTFEIVLNWSYSYFDETDKKTATTNKNIEQSCKLSDFEVDTDGNYVLTLSGLSPDTEYMVKEVEGSATVDGYILTTTVNGNSGFEVRGKVEAGEYENVEFSNTYRYSIVPPTGLFTTKIPYMLMLAVATLGIFGFTVSDFKKRALRKREDD